MTSGKGGYHSMYVSQIQIMDGVNLVNFRQ